MARTPRASRITRPAPRLDAERLLAERARRQHLPPSTRLRDARALPELLRALQPVAPRAFTFPGTPPQLAPRVAFDDLAASEELRRRGAIVKGRFGGGKLGYVWAEDLPIFVAAYRHGGERLSPHARDVLALLEREGPTVRSEIKALLEIPGRALSAALIELQRAFLVTELQYETEWDNAWTLFADEHPGAADADIDRADAVDAVLARMLESLAFASDRQLSDRSGLGLAAVRVAMARLATAQHARAATVDGLGEVWLAPGVDAATTLGSGVCARGPLVVSEPVPLVVSEPVPLVVSEPVPLVVSEVEPFEAVLQPQDPLVLTERTALGRRYGRSGVLAYIVIDGRFAGAAFGRWGISPFDVQDVQLDPPYDREPQRRRAIVEGLRLYFPPPAQRIRRWLGAPFEPPGER